MYLIKKCKRWPHAKTFIQKTAFVLAIMTFLGLFLHGQSFYKQSVERLLGDFYDPTTGILRDPENEGRSIRIMTDSAIRFYDDLVIRLVNQRKGGGADFVLSKELFCYGTTIADKSLCNMNVFLNHIPIVAILAVGLALASALIVITDLVIWFIIRLAIYVVIDYPWLVYSFCQFYQESNIPEDLSDVKFE